MADVSQIKLPSGTTYDIKDATARANSGVTGVKGSAESSYRTGNVNITAENVKAYAKGDAQIHRNPNNISADPQHASFGNSKNGLEYIFVRPIAGIGDWFYAAYLNPDYTITCNYSGKNGTKGNFALSTLFSPSAASTTLLDVDAIAENPFVLEITKTNGGNITATDVVHLELWGHTTSYSGAALSDYKVELLTTGSTASTGTYTWQTVYERTGASDVINGLTICLNPTSYSYLYFSGIRFTISGAIPGSTNPNAWNYNCIDLTLFRLIDQRPAFTTARAIGALDLAGGDVYGATNFRHGITGNLTGNVTGNVSGTANNVTGTVAVAHGGTGQTTAINAANAFANALTTGSSDPVDADYYISQYAGGGTTTTTYHRRPHSALWNYIKDKISSILGLTASTYSGKASTAGSADTATNVTGTVAIEHGGTGATSASAARTNLGLGSAATASTASTVGNNSNLPTGAAVQSYVTGLGYEANQNAFSNVKVGSTTVSADTETDTLELAAGSNITLTPDTTNDKVTIAATDTTYESKAAASGGTAVSLVTTGEKYTWNHKTSNTGTVTSVATGTGLTGGPITTSGTVSLATVHSTAPGAKGDTANQTPAFGGTFKVPSGTVDAYGRTTAFADHTVTIPSATFGRNAAGLVPASGSAVTDMVQILADDGNWYQLDGDIVNVTSSSGSETLTDFVQTTLPDMLDEKQDALVSGTNIKTINSQSILGSGNIQISGGGIVPDDYVIAHGTSGNWYYRKWNSGRIEAWGALNVTQSKTTAVGQIHRTTWSTTIPAAVGFTSAPTVNLSYNVDASVFFGLSGHATSATAISGYGFRYSASTSTSATGISIYCWGT